MCDVVDVDLTNDAAIDDRELLPHSRLSTFTEIERSDDDSESSDDDSYWSEESCWSAVNDEDCNEALNEALNEAPPFQDAVTELSQRRARDAEDRCTGRGPNGCGSPLREITVAHGSVWHHCSFDPSRQGVGSILGVYLETLAISLTWEDPLQLPVGWVTLPRSDGSR